MMDGWDWFWGPLMMLLFWGGLVVVIVWAVRGIAGSTRPASAEARDAKAILEARFAKGEISREEFEERTRVLESRAA